MALFQILSIIGFLFIEFFLIPLGIYYGQKRENKNRIKKVNIKKIIISYYAISGITTVILGIFIFLAIKNDITDKNKNYTIPETKIETKKEYFYGENIHTPLGEYNPKEYPLDEEPYLGSDGKTWYLYKNSKDTIKGEHKIERTYTFYGLNGLGRGKHREHEPNDIAPFVKNPFDKWYEKGYTVDEFKCFHTKNKDKDSQFDGGNGVSVNPLNHAMYINYEGPNTS